MLQGVGALFHSEPLRRLLVRLRKPLGLVAAVAILLNVDPDWWLPGLAVSLAGAAGQWWCFASIHTAKALACNGPYVWLANPMYVARYFLLLGALLYVGVPWLLVPFTVVYYLYMHHRVEREEARLLQVLGEEYRDYRRAVRRFVPTFPGFPRGRIWYWNRAHFARNHGWTNALAVVSFHALAALAVLRAQAA